MVVKRFETYVSWEIGPFFEENSLFPKEVAFSFGELGPFLRDNSLFHEEVVFSLEECFLLFMKVFFWGTSFTP